MFDSLAQEIKFELKNKSGVYLDIDINTISHDILSLIDQTPVRSISHPVESPDKSVYIIYVFKKTPSSKPTLENSWESISAFTKNEKINKVFSTWLSENKGKTFIKYFNP